MRGYHLPSLRRHSARDNFNYFNVGFDWLKIVRLATICAFLIRTIVVQLTCSSVAVLRVRIDFGEAGFKNDVLF
jgi:hypothetical protein